MMCEPEPRLKHLEKGHGLPLEYSGIIDEARNAVASTAAGKVQQWMLESIDSIQAGKYDLLVMHCGDYVAGIMGYNILENDVQIYFCHVRAPYRVCEGWFFRTAVSLFKEQGLQIVRTSFQWPSPDEYVKVAGELGFIELERISMLRENDSSYSDKPLPEGIEIQPWSDAFLLEAGQLLFAEANPVDRQIYPQLKSLEGTVGQLSKITCNFYGNFLPSQSMVALQDGKLIGLLLATEFGNELILIAEIAVAKSHRGRGIASAMLGRLIRSSAVLGKRQMELVVNSQNREAIRLYERKGFLSSVTFKQYILVYR
ncbi:GNAT family N-acetyltransferase [Methanocella arvoryzae]|nr:GNAT family N-acetyltransferase [Methanocella arvoryzae]